VLCDCFKSRQQLEAECAFDFTTSGKGITFNVNGTGIVNSSA
jgi:hypothetical protein